MAIQLAHYRLHRAFAPTYETGHTRAFYHGRTDTVRTQPRLVRLRARDGGPARDGRPQVERTKAACVSHGEQLPRVPHPFLFTPSTTPNRPNPTPNLTRTRAPTDPDPNPEPSPEQASSCSACSRGRALTATCWGCSWPPT